MNQADVHTQTLVVRGATIEQALEEARAQLGVQEILVLNASRMRRGGVAGFFAKDLGVELEVIAAENAHTLDAIGDGHVTRDTAAVEPQEPEYITDMLKDAGLEWDAAPAVVDIDRPAWVERALSQAPRPEQQRYESWDAAAQAINSLPVVDVKDVFVDATAISQRADTTDETADLEAPETVALEEAALEEAVLEEVSIESVVEAPADQTLAPAVQDTIAEEPAEASAPEQADSLTQLERDVAAALELETGTDAAVVKDLERFLDHDGADAESIDEEMPAQPLLEDAGSVSRDTSTLVTYSLDDFGVVAHSDPVTVNPDEPKRDVPKLTVKPLEIVPASEIIPKAPAKDHREPSVAAQDAFERTIKALAAEYVFENLNDGLGLPLYEAAEEELTELVAPEISIAPEAEVPSARLDEIAEALFPLHDVPPATHSGDVFIESPFHERDGLDEALAVDAVGDDATGNDVADDDAPFAPAISELEPEEERSDLIHQLFAEDFFLEPQLRAEETADLAPHEPLTEDDAPALDEPADAAHIAVAQPSPLMEALAGLALTSTASDVSSTPTDDSLRTEDLARVAGMTIEEVTDVLFGTRRGTETVAASEVMDQPAPATAVADQLFSGIVPGVIAPVRIDQDAEGVRSALAAIARDAARSEAALAAAAFAPLELPVVDEKPPAGASWVRPRPVAAPAPDATEIPEAAAPVNPDAVEALPAAVSSVEAAIVAAQEVAEPARPRFELDVQAWLASRNLRKETAASTIEAAAAAEQREAEERKIPAWRIDTWKASRVARTPQPVVHVKNTPSQQVISRLHSLGVPHSVIAGLEEGLTLREALAPVRTIDPSHANVTLVLGKADLVRKWADGVAGSYGMSREEVVVVSSAPDAGELGTVESVQAWRSQQLGNQAVVALTLHAPSTNLRFAQRLVEAARADMVRLVVEADDTRSIELWSKIAPHAVLDIVGMSRSTRPGALLALDLPIATVDGAPATRELLALTLLEHSAR